MGLLLEVEFLTGVCRAASEPGDDAPDWPPQPDRVFSALVSAWAVRGERQNERAALEWLEAQPPPAIHASDHTLRTTPEVFVPPNDPKASSAARMYIKVMPSSRPRQPRRFPTVRPDDPLVAMFWRTEPEPQLCDALNAIAYCVGYLGHSASLVRCRFRLVDAVGHPASVSLARRRVYLGRLRELEEAHRVNPVRPTIRPGAPVFAGEPSVVTPLESDWLALEVFTGEVPDVRAAALVCRVLRNSLMSGYRKVGLGDAIPEIVSGHTPSGAPSRHPHLAVAPLAFAGSRHADGRVLGFALIPPPGATLDGIDGLLNAFEAVAPYAREEARRLLTLQGPPLNAPLRLAPVPSDGTQKRSLSPEPYLQRSRIWASATPIVLERHLKRGDDAEARELVAMACQHAGLSPRPDPRRIRVSKHSAIEGMPPARPLTGEPPWARWKVPKSLASRQLVHAVIDFGEDVSGPVILGAGRFTGLGLCRGMGG